MRKYKFRGKSVNNSNWVYGDLIHFYDEQIGINALAEYDEEGKSVNGQYDETIFIDGKTVGQYTGLKDKNGKEIYEGDVLWDNNGYFYVVTFDSGAFCANGIIAKQQIPERMYIHYIGNIVVNVGAIIFGNIHDNPELLKPNAETPNPE